MYGLDWMATYRMRMNWMRMDSIGLDEDESDEDGLYGNIFDED